MTQAIIYTNENGGVSICMPTGELPIDEVLTKDCPQGAIIVNISELPTEYFDAWELVNNQVIVNQTKKQTIIDKQTSETNSKASAIAKLTALGLTQAEATALVG